MKILTEIAKWNAEATTELLMKNKKKHRKSH